MKTRITALCFALILCVCSAPQSLAANGGAPFADIENHWAAREIEYVYDMALMCGVGGNTFAPDQYITRGMFVTALGRYYLYYENPFASREANAEFTDVDPVQYYAKYVYWAAAFNIVKGVSETQFEPDSFITRQDLALIVYNYSLRRTAGVILESELEPPVFTDADSIRQDARLAIEHLYLAGIITGNSDGSFNPEGFATRAEAAAVLSRLDAVVTEYETRMEKEKLAELEAQYAQDEPSPQP